MRRGVWIVVLVAVVAGAAWGADTAASLQWRQVGVLSSAETVSTLGSWAGDANGPGTEFATCENGLRVVTAASGAMVVATTDRHNAWPVITAPVTVGSGATFDLPVRWVYETDNLVSSQPFTEFGQTFVATGNELERISFFTAADPGDFDIVIRKEGPKGDQVGSTCSVANEALSPGGARGGTAAWKPGEVPLEAGKTYYVGIKSRSAKPFSFCLHSTGDAYLGGVAWFNGIPQPNSDLGLLITLQNDTAVKSPVLFPTDNTGWVRHGRGVYFKAQSANVRAAYIELQANNLPKKLDVLIRCSKLNSDSTLVRVGPDKLCGAIADCGVFHAAAVYGPNELPVVPGQTYYLEVIAKGAGSGDPGAAPEDGQAPKLDLRVGIYGEKTPGMTPVIYNQQVKSVTETSVGLSWDGTPGAKARIDYGLSPYDLRFSIDVPKDVTTTEIHPIRPGTTFYFRMTSDTDSGGRFETPVYVARTLDSDGKPVENPPLPKNPDGFMPLAPMDYLIEQPAPPAKGVAPVDMPDGDFARGLTGWTVSPDKSAEPKPASGSEKASVAVSGESTIYQVVGVRPGRTYILSAELNTDPAENGAWARLVFDPKGGVDFAGLNSTQWYRTGGRWMRFWQPWKAESKQVTIGVGFTRGKCEVRNVELFEVGQKSVLQRIIGK